MSRIGKVPIKIASGIKVDIRENEIKVEGPKGKLLQKLPLGIVAKVDQGFIHVMKDEKNVGENINAKHGVIRTLVANMLKGVSLGFEKELDIVGVGYRATVKGSTLTLSLGYSHPIDYHLPPGITAKVDQNTHLVVSGADKMLVGLVAAKIRSFREPEPYQGKGVKYTHERIIRKQGKAAGAKQ